ncbi:Helix-turn-helix domain-containing protein [Rhodospirillales bacterium URHD0017]|nr:Helix-turn-helix domain-containing protein [Rhodospirillales bacterium URHD0017]
MLPGMDKVAQTTRDIGNRLRSARTGAGATLASVARQAGLSESFLSRLERGQAVASIANLIQLAEALGLGLHELFHSASAPARTRVAVHRGGGANLKDVAATGYRFRHLGGGAPLDRLEVFHLVFPRAKGMPATVSHPGQEHCYVLSGEVLFHVDGVTHRLKPGDGILIDSQLPHRAENAGRGQAHVLMTVARPAESSDVPDWWHLATSTEKEKARP